MAEQYHWTKRKSMFSFLRRFFGKKKNSPSNIKWIKEESPKVSLKREPDLFDDIRVAAHANNIPFQLLKAQVWQESRFIPTAISPSGARGLLQLMPRTARELGVTNSFDITQNLNGGGKYLHQRFMNFKSVQGMDRWRMALASYNCGMGYVIAARKLAREKKLNSNSWAIVAVMLSKVVYRGRRPIWKETVHYVHVITDQYYRYQMEHLAMGNLPKSVFPSKGE